MESMQSTRQGDRGRRHAALFGVAIIVLLSSTACSSGSGTTAPRPRPTVASGSSVKSTAEMQTMNVRADYAYVDDGIDELYQRASVVVMGQVTEVDYRVSPEFDAYTVTTVKVSKVLKGNVTSGESITVVEPGGVMSKADFARGSGREYKATPEDETTLVRVSWDGAPGRLKGEKLVYFLAASSADETLDKPYFRAVGPLAEFVITGTQAKRFVPEGWPSDSTPLKIGDLEAQIRASAKSE